jgi:biotin carboxyl carrier protein
MSKPIANLLPGPARTLEAGDAADAAIELQLALLAHADLQGAAAALVRELASRFGCDRVALAFLEGEQVQVAALSDAPSATAASPLVERLAAAMAEALDQRASLLLPESRPHAHPRIVLAQRRLLGEHGGSVASVPLMAGGSMIGALCAQRFAAPAIAAAELEALERLSGIAGPLLELMRRNERSLLAQLRERMARSIERLRRPERAALRYGLVAAALLASALALLPADYHVGGHARLEGAVQRVLVAPADGFLRQVHARPGERVRAGQPLVELAEQDLRLERQRWQSQMAQYENAYAAANAHADRAQLVINQSKAAEAEAQLALVDMKLARSRIEAPFDGVVIRGDLSQSLGAPVQQGAELMTIAPRDRYRVIVEVDERDIAAVRVGQRGSLALSALPWNTLPIEVRRITPMASVLEGRNVFEVEAELLQRSADLRPGLQGTARIVAGREPLLWSWSHRLVDALRLAAWEWLG